MSAYRTPPPAAARDALATALRRARLELAAAIDPGAALEDPLAAPTPTPEGARRADLAQLAALEYMRRHIEDQAAVLAHGAGHRDGAPATYADLGAAVGITRQAARTRWPNAVTARPGRPRRSTAPPADPAPPPRAAAATPAPPELKRPLSEWLWTRLCQIAAHEPDGAHTDDIPGARWHEYLDQREILFGKRAGQMQGRGYITQTEHEHNVWRWHLTEAGREHICAYRDSYAALYPGVRQPRAVRELSPDTPTPKDPR